MDWLIGILSVIFAGAAGSGTTYIRTFITGWNDRCHPFVWTKPADQILAKANRQNTSETVH